MSLPKMLTAKPNGLAIPAWAMAAGIALLFLGVAGFAKATGHWESPIPNAVYQALVQVLEGSAEITVTGKPLQARTGDAILLPANQPHAVKASTRFKMLLTMIRS
jgi:hypothetical protein